MFDNLIKLQFDKKNSIFKANVLNVANDIKQFEFENETTNWQIIHNYNTKNVIVQTFNLNNELIVPDSVIIDLNSINITFTDAVSGFVNAMFVSGDLDAMNQPSPTPSISITPTVSPTVTPTGN